MTASLPPKANLEQLRKQAKDILKAHRNGDPSCCAVLRHLHRFGDRPNDEILSANVGLQEVQFALAMDHGFNSWTALKDAVEASLGLEAVTDQDDALVAAMREQLGDVSLAGRGSGFERDTFCLAMQEVARILGRPLTYETLLALTTNAFAPGFDTGNDCKDLWVAEAWVSHIAPLEPAWAYLGLAVTPLPLPDPPTDRENTEAEAAHRRECAGMIREAMAHGKIVVTTGGWDHRKAHWVEPWWAGIVTEVTDSGAVLGAHLNGRKDNELVNFPRGEIFAVSLAKESSDDGQMNRALLPAAVARIRARGEHFRRREFCAFGVDAMDDWIDQMRSVAHFCPPCQEKKGNGYQSAFTVARAMLHRCHEAAAFLHARADTFPTPARPYIENAAGHYERILALLRPTATPEGNHHYKTFIGDLDKQREHADTVLRPVKDELAGAADEMEEALAAMA